MSLVTLWGGKRGQQEVLWQPVAVVFPGGGWGQMIASKRRGTEYHRCDCCSASTAGHFVVWGRGVGVVSGGWRSCGLGVVEGTAAGGWG